VSPTGVDRHAAVNHVHLGSVSVSLDLVRPFITGRGMFT
jgi:hypothetical protein